MQAEITWGERLGDYKRDWTPPQNLELTDWKLLGYYEQDITFGLEVLAFHAGSRAPKKETLRAIHKSQEGSRPTPVLVVAFYGMKKKLQTTTIGLNSNKVFFCEITSNEALEKAIKKALEEPSRFASTVYLERVLPRLEGELPGIHNTGLFSTHELEYGVPKLKDWNSATSQASQLKNSRGRNLVEGLGYKVITLAETRNLSLLSSNGYHKAIAIFLNDDEPYDMRGSKHSRFVRSPVSDAAIMADKHNVDWVIITRSSEIRLYAAKSEIGVGSGSRTEKYLEIDLDIIPDSLVGYLQLVFSATALENAGSLEILVNNSSRFAAELAKRLRERVYKQTVPILANTFAKQISNDPSEDDLKNAYEQVMLVLFRLLFIAYCEDREFLPIGNQEYRKHSLTGIAKSFVDKRKQGEQPFGDGDQQTGLWKEFKLLGDAINHGNPRWNLPAYDGGLFSKDSEVNLAGAVIESMDDICDKDFGRALEALLLDDTSEGIGLVDFRDLSVREFGTIYEGLLESRFSVAPCDLTLDKDNIFVPVKGSDSIEVFEGDVFFHNRSGARKSAGSYFTKVFAVEHLLEFNLKPALDSHIEQLEKLLETEGENEASAAFFDFRCADIAMGSGHFLILALDMIAERLSSFLEHHPLKTIDEELTRLLARARNNLRLPIDSELSSAENGHYENKKIAQGLASGGGYHQGNAIA